MESSVHCLATSMRQSERSALSACNSGPDKAGPSNLNPAGGPASVSATTTAQSPSNSGPDKAGPSNLNPAGGPTSVSATTWKQTIDYTNSRQGTTTVQLPLAA